MTECPYFFYGAAIDNPGQYCQYGLYNPVLDCFVLVHSDLSMLRLLLKLFSSRYYLILCRLDLAQNFDKNLLDNSVCINWTVENSDQFLFTKIQNFTSKEIEVAFGAESAGRVQHAELKVAEAIEQAKSFGAADPEATPPVMQARAAYKLALEGGNNPGAAALALS
jgi:hypothetical protein